MTIKSTNDNWTLYENMRQKQEEEDEQAKLLKELMSQNSVMTTTCNGTNYPWSTTTGTSNPWTTVTLPYCPPTQTITYQPTPVKEFERPLTPREFKQITDMSLEQVAKTIFIPGRLYKLNPEFLKLAWLFPCAKLVHDADNKDKEALELVFANSEDYDTPLLCLETRLQDSRYTAETCAGVTKIINKKFETDFLIGKKKYTFEWVENALLLNNIRNIQGIVVDITICQPNDLLVVAEEAL